MRAPQTLSEKNHALYDVIKLMKCEHAGKKKLEKMQVKDSVFVSGKLPASCVSDKSAIYKFPAPIFIPTRMLSYIYVQIVNFEKICHSVILLSTKLECIARCI